MSAPFLGLTPEFWLFGFIPTVYTNDWKSGLAIVLIVEYAINLFAVHAADAVDAATCTELLWMATTTHATAVFLGAAVGLAFVFATDFPNVFNMDFYFSSVQRSVLMGGYLHASANDDLNSRPSDTYYGVPWKSKPYAWTFFGLVLPLIFIYTSILFFIGRYTMVGAFSITQGQSNAIGAVFVTLAVIFLVAYIVVVFWRPKNVRFPDGHGDSGRLNLKYGLLMTLALATPAAFDYTNAWSAWARFGLHIGVAFVVYLLTAWLGRYDRYLGTEKAVRVFLTFLAIWVIHLSIYIASAFITVQDTIFAWTAAWSAGWIIVLLIIGFVQRRRAAYAMAMEKQEKRRSKSVKISQKHHELLTETHTLATIATDSNMRDRSPKHRSTNANSDQYQILNYLDKVM